MFIAESLACGVPVVGYDVGFLGGGLHYPVGVIMNRNNRSPETTLQGVRTALAGDLQQWSKNARAVAKTHLSIEHFNYSWREYVSLVENR